MEFDDIINPAPVCPPVGTPKLENAVIPPVEEIDPAEAGPVADSFVKVPVDGVTLPIGVPLRFLKSIFSTDVACVISDDH